MNLLSLSGVIILLAFEILALKQSKDIMKLLIFSTVAQVGGIVAVYGLGTYLGVTAGIYHLLNNVIMKGLLFLAAGAIAYRVKGYDIKKFKGIGKVMPVTSACMGIGILASMGLPPFNGYISKDLMLYADVKAGYWYLAAVLLFAGIIAAIYYAKLIRTLCFEKYEGPAVKDVPVVIQLLLIILAGLVLINGFFPQYALTLVKSAAAAVAGNLPAAVLPEVGISWPVMVIVPMVGGIIAYFTGKLSATAGGWMAVLGMAASLAAIFVSGGKLDIYSVSFAVLIAFVGLLNMLYSLGYMKHEHAQGRYYMFFMMMIGGLIGIATSNNFDSFFTFWEIMSSWTLYFVIIHEETEDALREGFKYFVFNYVGASIVLMGMFLLTTQAGTTEIAEITKTFKTLPTVSAVWVWALVLMAIGFLMKAAALPFRIDYQMHPATAPTPVSGYISSVLLKAAPFWIIRLFFIIGGIEVLEKFGCSSIIMNTIAWIGGLTIVGAGAMALVQRGLKRLLIYSTVSQIGYIVLGLGIGGTLGLSGSLLHFVNHMFFKDLLFLCAGAIMVQAHAKNLDEVSGLGKKMPYTMTFFLIGALSLAGIPPFSGFTSKWLIYEAAMQNGQVFLAVLSLAGSVLSTAYFIKFMHSAFFGAVPKKLENVKEASWIMLLPMGVLSVISLVLGIMPGLSLTVISKVLAMAGIKAPEFTLFSVKTPLGAWQVGVVLILLILGFLLGGGLYLFGNKKVRYVNAYTCGNVDIDPDVVRSSCQNMFESPKKLIMSIHSKLIVPIFGNGEEALK